MTDPVERCGRKDVSILPIMRDQHLPPDLLLVPPSSGVPRLVVVEDGDDDRPKGGKGVAGDERAGSGASPGERPDGGPGGGQSGRPGAGLAAGVVAAGHDVVVGVADGALAVVVVSLVSLSGD